MTSNMKNLMVSVFALVVSSKCFGCISGIYRTIGLGKPITWDSIIQTGIVYYGGLIGMLVTFGFCVKRKGEDSIALDALAVSIPLFHMIARVGCFLGGCCYGKEINTPFSIKYTTMANGVINTAFRIPVQLIESLFELFIFFYLLFLVTRNNWQERHILDTYLLFYSIIRFFLEFLRGDIERGIIAGISFSQVISLMILLYLFIKRIYKRKDECKC